jgi:hypothetical protein
MTRVTVVGAGPLLTLSVAAFAQKVNTVWRGVGTDTVSSKPVKNTATFEKAIQQMFQQYPPQSK